MYNRYIGNTGKFYRIDDEGLPHQDAKHFPTEPPSNTIHPKEGSPSSRPSLSISSGEITGSLKSIIGQFLPDGMEIGDLLLILILLLLYLEKEDEEILIILSVLIFMGFK